MCCGMRQWVKTLCAVVLLWVCVPMGATAVESAGSDTAQTLAKRALESVRRGEDAPAKEAKLSAYREAQTLAERAVALADDNADAHFALFAAHGRILLLQGATANPLNLLTVNRDLDRALQLNPNHSDALAAKGGLYRQLPWVLGGSLQKAEAYLMRAIEIDPNAVTARIELAETYRAMGYPDRGVPLLEAAVQVAQAAGKLRQLAEARSLLRELNPEP